jgi:hypothetical protein
VQWEPEKDNAPNAVEGVSRLGLRGHSPPEGLAAGKVWKMGRQAYRLADRGSNGCLGNGRGIGTPGAHFHVRELVAERRHPLAAKVCGEFFHERVGHAGARSVCENKTGMRIRRHDEQA